MNKIWNIISYSLGILCVYFCVIPYVLYGIINIGSLILLLTGIFFVLLPKFLYKYLVEHKFIRKLVVTAFTIFFVLSGFMCWAAYINTAKPNETQVVVVLGAKTVNGRPSRMLRNRLDEAKVFCDKGFQGKIIVCGKSPESDIMKNYLVEQGINPNRIILENQSTSTEENIFYAAKIINTSGLPKKIAIASDGFHQLRSQIFAKSCGLECGSISATTQKLLLPSYWLRDMGGVVVAMLKSFMVNI